jgi:hypothetical protein
MTAPFDPAVLESPALYGNDLPLPGDPDYDEIPHTGQHARADAMVIMGVVREHFGLSRDF